MNFFKKLRRMEKKNNTLLSIGLDPDLNKIPAFLRRERYPAFAFNRLIIEATADLVCAYKPQVAFYAGQAAEEQLERTIAYLKETHPEIPILLDAKRGDIGNTAAFYAREAFDRYEADAVTVNPYLGGDSLIPFLEREEKGVIVLCRTSNPGSSDFQELEANGKKLFQIVAQKAVEEWNFNKNIGLVVGATYPQDLKTIRTIAPHLLFLVPGIGAQGGDLEAVLANGLSSCRDGLIINSSRSIIYAGEDKDFAASARKAALSLVREIRRLRPRVGE